MVYALEFTAVEVEEDPFDEAFDQLAKESNDINLLVNYYTNSCSFWLKDYLFFFFQYVCFFPTIDVSLSFLLEVCSFSIWMSVFKFYIQSICFLFIAYMYVMWVYNVYIYIIYMYVSIFLSMNAFIWSLSICILSSKSIKRKTSHLICLQYHDLLTEMDWIWNEISLEDILSN